MFCKKIFLLGSARYGFGHHRKTLWAKLNATFWRKAVNGNILQRKSRVPRYFSSKRRCPLLIFQEITTTFLFFFVRLCTFFVGKVSEWISTREWPLKFMSYAWGQAICYAKWHLSAIKVTKKGFESHQKCIDCQNTLFSIQNL